MRDWDSLDAVAQFPQEQLDDLLRQWMNGRPTTEISAAEDAIQKRIRSLVTTTEQNLVERRDLVRCCVASLVSGVPMVVLGPPGTGKSMCVRLIADRCRGRSSSGEGAYFEYLLTSHTMPEELFGPPDLTRLKQGEFARRTTRMLPEAEFAFLDEVFRGGTHILNTLLSILNERRFHDGAEVRRIPLLGVIAASNHPPSDPDTSAFYDRFPIRLWIDSIFETDAHTFEHRMSGLLVNASQHHRLAVGDQAGASRSAVACTNDFRIAEAILAIRSRPDGELSERTEEFAEGVEKVRRLLQLSDRSIGSLWRFGAALDWLEGNDITGSTSDGSSGHLEAITLAAGTLQLHRRATQLIDAIRNGRGVRSNH